MRNITSHQVNECNKAINITADTQDAENGNASHDYRCVILDADGEEKDITHIEFQNGPIKEVGVNGLTHEVLLAILIDRLRGFQSSKYACRENALALTKLEEAKMWLNERTKGREDRGVEGTHTV
jgi:hypothetical protein